MTFEGVSQIAVTEQRKRLRSKRRYLRLLMKGELKDTLANTADFISTAKIPAELFSFMREHCVDFIHVNHCFNMDLAIRIRDLAKEQGQTPAIACETHDVQSSNDDVLRARNAFGCRSWKSNIVKTELNLLSSADLLLHISKSDKDYFDTNLPNTHGVLLIPTLAPATERILKEARGALASKHEVAFFGTSHHWNIKSVEWLLDLVIPRVPELAEHLRIYGNVVRGIERRRPDLFSKYKGAFKGMVSSPQDVYRNAKVALIPTQEGTGASIKFVEALCSDSRIVFTSYALRGLPPEIGTRLSKFATNDPVTFAKAMKHEYASDNSRLHSANIYDLFFSNAQYRHRFDAAFGKLQNAQFPSAVDEENQLLRNSEMSCV